MRPATWAVARARLPGGDVRWRAYQACAGEAPEALAELAHRIAPPPPGTEPVHDVLAHMYHAPLAAVESRDGVPLALWTFAWEDAVLDLELPSRVHLQASGCDRVARAPPLFLEAAAHAIAHAVAQREGLVAVHDGVVRVPPWPADGAAPRAAELHRLRVHTTPDELVVQVVSTHKPWAPLDMRARPGESVPRHVELGHTTVCLIPTLQRATLLHTLAAPDDAACAALATRLATPLQQVGGRTDHWVVVRVPIAWLPPGAPLDAVALSVPPGAQRDTAVPCQLLWPAALCLVVRTPEPRPPPLALLRKSAADLLASATWPRAEPSSPAPAETMGPVVGIGAPLPPPVSPVEDDVFQGIGQLPDDDLRFFGAHAPPAPPPPPPAADVSTEAPPEPPPPTLHVSEPQHPPLAVKYDMHGKFFVGSAYRRIPESDMRTAVSPRALYLSTPQSAVHSSPSQVSGWDEPDEGSDEGPRIPAAQCALACARFHSALCGPALPAPGSSAEALTERVHLEWTCTYAGAARYPPEPPAEQPPAPLTSPGTAVPLSAPSVLVGCQAALIHVEPDAVRRWRWLGLQPSGGPRHVVAHVALLDVDVPPAVVQQWLALGADTYAAHGLGTLTPGNLWRYHGGLWASGMPNVPESAASAGERHVVYLVYEQPGVCERLYRTWPMPRSRIAIVAVPMAHMLPMQWSMALAYAAYEDANARVCQLAPSTYRACTRLKEGLHWDGQWPRAEPAVSPLHSGAVLHVAYDRRGGVVRLVATDERAWLRHTCAWDAVDERADVMQLWHTVRGLLAASAARWYVVVCRYGAMAQAEADAWAAWKAQKRWDTDALDVVVVSLDTDGPRVVADGALHAWTASTTGLAMHAEAPVVAARTAYVSAGAYAVHWVLHDEEAAVLHDVVVHFHALHTMTQLRWPPPAPLLPWHVALLAHA